ncbi:uridine diphosphate-N-acetylglucosamine-binding protein YvcK [Micromonospora sp. DR5-3]|uniref:gluconeogenesis factor YvcK family protein n=1 Tax=unclassified Micromonospora TaxID=2617518 RepID=UPI0011D5248A|nr:MULTISPECIES: uridine diphosphate-N-acetylglucosamine-binding protein YvcK [unclassified Micromonospora]MCW3817039.1 uridine diphosphate-N-acetylglucosamine-binding protein YvcK [Micromonospora sp. DR5-3]TYC19314.1 uridine diphosphate-N-acetylglucosamine-binding protein YvcK [Micromonospora sp. MP36]
MIPTRVVAFGGGHGLSASLRALRHCVPELDLDITAVVTVGDDGGSSGRLRAERGGLPPGDLRQALVALAGDHPATRRSAALFQHRFAVADGGEAGDSLAGHAVGNLLISGLTELLGDPVAALDHAGAMLGAVGRVLPMTCQPVDIEARVRGADPGQPDEVRTVRGQHQVAVTSGRVESLRLTPSAPAACAEAVAAVRAADWLIFGPGSWYTSVLPHLLVPELADAIVSSPARRLVTLNLVAEKETLGLSLADHLDTLRRYLPELKVDMVLADSTAVGDPGAVAGAAESLGARLVLAPVAVLDGTPRHDPAALGAALVPVLGADR